MAVLSSRYAYEGTETTETSITRVGSPADPTGTLQSRKIVTTANSQWLRPFKATPYVAWNGVTNGNVTATVYGVVNADVAPNNDDIWMDVEHLKAASGVLGVIVTTTKSNLLAAGTVVTSDSSTWNASAFTSFNQFVATANITLSNNNLTATTSIGSNGVRAVNSYSSGKFYFEYTMTVWGINTTAIGLSLATGTLNSTSGTGKATVQNTGAINVNGVSTGFTLGTRAAGDVIGIAVDLTAQRIWFRVAPSGNWNGSGTANPATNTGGADISPIAGSLFPLVFLNAAGENVTANFGGSAFSGAVPSGFTLGWPTVWSPFKLTTTLDLNATAPIAAGAPATWDAATVTAVTLSGGNLVATNTGTTSADQGARGATAIGKDTGKYYFEVTFTIVIAGANIGVGIATTTSTYTGMGGNGTTGVELFKSTSIWAAGSSVVSGFTGSPGVNTSMDTGDLAGIAIDLDNRKAWFRTDPSGAWNNNASANPATNVGGLTIPNGTMVPIVTFGGTSGVANNVITANFGASSFAGAVPSGFTAGWPTSLAIPSYTAPVGYIEARVRAAKASAIYYIDPTIQLSPTTPTAGATTAYTTSRYAYEGTETTETSITRVNGAADPIGNRQSRKIVTTANSQWLRPFKAEPYAQWSNVTGADVSVTVCGTVNSGTLPLNDEIWMDVEYLGKVAAIVGNSTPITWDAATVTAVTLSGGNLVATNTGTTSLDQGARGPGSGLNSGKYYFEITNTALTAGGSRTFGIGSPGSTYTSMANATIGVMAVNGGAIYSNGIDSGMTIGNGMWSTVNMITGVAVDMDNRRIWFKVLNISPGNWNGNASYDPATNVGGVTIPPGPMVPYVTFGGSLGTANNIRTANFGSTAFTGTVPSGFTAGWSTTAPASESWIGKIVTTTKSNVLASGTSVTSDSSVWNNATSVPTTFDSGTSTNVALSNGNKTVTLSSASMGGARSILYKSSGKWYCEFTIGATSTGGDAAGVLISVSPYSEVVVTGTSCMVAYLSNGNIWSNGSYTSKTLGAIVAGDVVSVAVDLTNSRGWIRKNGGNWNADATANPATNVGGVTMYAPWSWSPVVAFGSSGAANNMTGNFGGSAYAYTPPAGFESWGNFYSPFKLTTTLSSPQPGVAGYIHVRPRVAKASSTFYIDPQINITTIPFTTRSATVMGPAMVNPGNIRQANVNGVMVNMG